MGDNSAGSRAQPVHIITLRDPEGDTIQPDDRRPLPFSTTQTCGADCHDVSAITRGWHFNPAGSPPGRNGQPWLWTDAATGTQIPLSDRGWPGTYRPSHLGIGAREFALHFGGRMPGGVASDDADRRSDRVRWTVSGNLEVNCLACHDASATYDQAEYARQIALENFRYAPAAASGIAAVTGSAKDMPDVFDYLLPGSVEDSLQTRIPVVSYARNRFLPGDKIAFDIVREVKTSRCYYCHTNIDVENTGNSRWKDAEDVHVARGIGCVQCHRNGLDHNIVRGYEGEAAGKDNFAASLSCRGCHMGPERRIGAPYPRHAGLPPIHLQKLTCTACHSGPRPEHETRREKNGVTHGLGEHNVNKATDVLPHISYPVFAQQEDGRLAPYRLVWPAFWGWMQSGSVQPLHPDEVRRILKESKLLRDPASGGDWPGVDDRWVVQVLTVLDRERGSHGLSVYVAGGKLRRLSTNGQLEIEDHQLALPYLWPLAHDVRPTSESLGAGGCEDCHSVDAPIFFGKVAVDSPFGRERPWEMSRFERKLDVAYQVRLARSWVFRPWLKAIGLGAAALFLLLLAGYVLKAWDRLAAKAAELYVSNSGH
jgi:hypothetical protein